MTGKTTPILAVAFAAAALISVQSATADVRRFGAMAFAAKSATDGPRTVGNVLKKALGKALRLSEEAADGVISGDAGKVRKAEAGLDGFMGGVLAEEMTELRAIVRIHETVGSAGAGLKRMAKAAGERVGRFFGRAGAAVDGRIALARDPGGAESAAARSIFASKPLPKANLAVLSTPSRRLPPPASSWTRKGASDPWGAASTPADPWARPASPSVARAAADPAAAESESRRTGRDGYKAALRTALNLEEGPARARRGYNEELAALEREAAARQEAARREAERRAEEARRREQARLAEERRKKEEARLREQARLEDERREQERIAAWNREIARRNAEANVENWNMFIQGLRAIAGSYVEAQQRQYEAAARQREARLRAERQQQERRRQEEARRQAENLRREEARQRTENLRQEEARQRAENLRQEEMERQRRAETRRRAEEERRRAEAQRRAEEERRRQAERQAREARRQACRARISGRRDGCVQIVRWSRSGTYHFRNTCDDPISIYHRRRDSRGGGGLTNLAPGAAGRTAPIYGQGTRKIGIEYMACFDDPGVGLRNGSCQLFSWACINP